MQDSKPTNFIVGLTGGIGSGKTVCSDHFQSIGVPIIDTDLIARDIVQPGQTALQDLCTAFGDSILLEDGTLDRRELRIVAFATDENKAKLDSITHPAIRQATRQKIAETDYPYCVIVIPLLTADSAFSHFLHRVLVVTADHETKIERVMKRSRLSREDILRIMQTQLNDDERLSFADDIIANDNTIADAQLAVEERHKHYLELAQSAQ